VSRREKSVMYALRKRPWGCIRRDDERILSIHSDWKPGQAKSNFRDPVELCTALLSRRLSAHVRVPKCKNVGKFSSAASVNFEANFDCVFLIRRALPN